ncbi:MAG: phosphatase PAP2 family protein [Candidatus Neomarinimicrobiota bacterium]|nr:phosphatase PAP2 family protein [Candidatus Neomarinimicrobiota bacterium]
MKNWAVCFLSVTTLAASQLSYGEYLAEGTKAAFTLPSNVTMMATAALSVLVLGSYDDEFRRYSQERGIMSDALSHQLDLYGGRWVYPALMGMSWLTPGSRDEKRERLQFSLSAIGVTATTTWLMKRLSGRERPNGNDRKSFPSGHTSGSFTVAAIMGELYGENAGMVAYLVAAMVGAHRIHDDKHWLTDVIAGAALGTAVGKGFSQVYREAGEESGVSLIPERNKQSIMITLVIPIN